MKCFRRDFLAQFSKRLFSVASWVHAFNFRSSCSHILFKICILKNLIIFTGKHLCWSLFLIISRPEDLKFLKTVFLIFKSSFSNRTSPEAAFVISCDFMNFLEIYSFPKIIRSISFGNS